MDLKRYDTDYGWHEMVESLDGCYYDADEADREIRRQKHKRCLAMARWCASRAVVWATEGNEKKSDWYWKWKEKWRELAEKFKPNSTAQQGKG